MELFWKSVAACLLAAVMGLTIEKQEKALAMLLGLGVCTLVMLLAIRSLQPVVDFIRDLQDLSNLQEDLPGILLKVLGIGIVGEMAGMICSDTGNKSLSRALQLMTTVIMLRLALQVIQTNLDLIQTILGDV